MKIPFSSWKPVEEEAAGVYRSWFDAEPQVVSFAPGRVEILGNHTDYNGGFVMSVGLDLGIAIAAGRAAAGGRCQVFSATLNAESFFDLGKLERRERRRWVDYPMGVLRELARSGVPLEAVRMAVASDLPLGAGISSSAAFELATAEAAYGLFGGRPADRMEEPLLCQRAEVEYVGMPCGLLDQFSSTFARAGSALFLDCATREWAALPLGRAVSLVLADTRVKHALVDGKYAELRASCERAAKRLGELLQKPVRFLRDVSLRELERVGDRLEAEDRPRAAHVVAENDRVLRGKALLEAGCFEALGALMLESHRSSSDLFGNSCPELDLLVEEASKLPGFLGGKLSGGGFGGCTVNLVEPEEAAGFAARLAERYRSRTGAEPRMIQAGIGDGARVGPPTPPPDETGG
jgi:galactokinase